MGLGGGTVLLIYLSLAASLPQLTAQGINLLVFVPTAAVAVTLYSFKKKIAWKRVLYMAPLGIAGSLAGSFLLRFIPSELLSKILGVILIIMGVNRLFSRKACKEEK
jgi:uncharacterized membrane protein YfcA